MKWTIFALIFLSACVHTAPEPEIPFVKFPARFFSEQVLTLTTPQATRQLKAQLQRGADHYDLVLVEPRFGIVLARAIMDGNGAKTQYLAPQIDPKTLPLQDIGNSIRGLYEAPAFTKEGRTYVFQLYRLDNIRGTPACAYPKDISLRFRSENYRLDIAVESFTCS